PYPIYESPAGEPLAAEAGAKPETIQLGDAGKGSKDKLALVVNSQTAGVDLVQLNINDYPQTVERKAPLTLLQSSAGLARPFATLGVHVFIGGEEVHGPLKEGETASSVNSGILYKKQYVWKVESKSKTEVTLLMTALKEDKPVAEIRK